MSLSKDQIIVWSDRLRLVRLFTGSARHRLTTILYHQFQFGEESFETARERLKTAMRLFGQKLHGPDAR